jgi:hypothetical protein
MHARDLIEVAGLVALHGPQLVGLCHTSNSLRLEQYWSASKCRFESWSRVLKRHGSSASGQSAEEFDKWIELRSTLDEIFTSEILTRLWTAVVVASDRLRGADTAEALARNVLATHVEARHRALTLLLDPRGFQWEALAVNRLRRRAERWTDLLLGGLEHVCDIKEFAIEAERATDFAIDLAQRRNDPGGRHAWNLTLVSLRNSFRGGLSPIAANPAANARIAAGILECFPEELFDSSGVFRSLWMVRLAANASDAQGLISDLLGSTPPTAAPVPRTAWKRI